jgi:hypothetical protein
MSQSDNAFVEELAKRLNTFLEQSPDRANAVLATPMPYAGYAGVAHFLGELSLPKGIGAEVSPEEIQSALFLFPVIEDNKIKRFDVVTGEFLQKQSEESKQIH